MRPLGRHWGPLAFAALAAASFALFWQLRLSLLFIDETDVPVFGRLVAQGRVLHQDLFSHHTHLEPLFAWMVAALAPQAGLEAYRGVVWLLQGVAALSLALSPLFDRRGAGWVAGGLYLLLATAIGPLWYGHMIMAYNLWGALCVASLAVFYAPWLLGRDLGRWAPALGGLFSSLWIMGTPFTVYPVAALLALACVARPWVQVRALGPFALGLGLGLGLQLLWLSVHADLPRLWQQSILFNANVFAPFSGEPKGLGGRLWAVALDFKNLVAGARTMERIFLGGVLAAAWLVYRHASPRVGRARAWLAALLAVLFFVGLRMRGGHWRSMPFVFATLGVWSLLLGALIDRGRKRPAMILYVLLALLSLKAIRSNLPLFGLDSFRGEPTLDLARSWDADLPRDETVLVVPVRSSVYLLSRRAPGMDAVYYYPWIAEWERLGGRGPHGGLCDQVRHYRPRYILLDRHAMVWSFRWADYQPPCLDGLLRQGYRRRAFGGKEELWERLTPQDGGTEWQPGSRQ